MNEQIEDGHAIDEDKRNTDVKEHGPGEESGWESHRSPRITPRQDMKHDERMQKQPNKRKRENAIKYGVQLNKVAAVPKRTTKEYKFKRHMTLPSGLETTEELCVFATTAAEAYDIATYIHVPHCDKYLRCCIVPEYGEHKSERVVQDGELCTGCESMWCTSPKCDTSRFLDALL